MKVSIVYYSAFGNIFRMANLVAEGVHKVSGAEAVIRRVPELVPDSLVQSRADMKAGAELQKNIPFVTNDDFKGAGAIALGTPTRFGNVSAQLKYQIDQLGPLWMQKAFEGKGIAHASGRSANGRWWCIGEISCKLAAEWEARSDRL